MTYQPQFPAEVYLRFLNKSLYLARDLSNKVSFRIFIGAKMIEFIAILIMCQFIPTEWSRFVLYQ